VVEIRARGALAELIAADEQVEPHAFGLREVAADSSDVDGVAAAIASCDRKRRNCSATTSINSHAQIFMMRTHLGRALSIGKRGDRRC
jgi:hypothetical protein